MFSRSKKRNKPRGAVRMQVAHNNDMSLVINMRWVLVFVFFGLLGASAWYVNLNWQKTVVPLEQVTIDGEFKYLAPEQLQQTIKTNLYGGYFTIDLHQVRQALLQLPWVEEVSVRRQWPSGLHITVQEKRAIAYWGDDSLLSDNGEVFTPASIAGDMSLPVLNGPAGLHKTVWQFIASLHEDFGALNLQINKLVLDQRRAWQLHLSNGAIVRLGKNETEQRLKRFSNVFAMSNAPDISFAAVIDMRYPNGFAIFSKTKNMEEKINTHELARVSEG